MTDNLITAIITLAGAIILFILQDIYQLSIKNPYEQYLEIRARIAREMVFYANIYSNPIALCVNGELNKNQEYENAQTALRELAADLTGVFEVIKHRRISMWLFNIPDIDKIVEVKEALIGLSNSLYTNSKDSRISDKILERENIIKEHLKLQLDK